LHDTVMYDVRGMSGTEWKACSKFDRCGIPYQRYLPGNIFIIDQCSFGCKLSVTGHAYREIGFIPAKQVLAKKIKGNWIIRYILALFPLRIQLVFFFQIKIKKWINRLIVYYRRVLLHQLGNKIGKYQITEDAINILLAKSVSHWMYIKW